jgi:hypothetical protein
MSTWTLEVLEAFTIKQDGHVQTCSPGQRITLSPEKAQIVIDRVGTKVRRILKEKPSNSHDSNDGDDFPESSLTRGDKGNFPENRDDRYLIVTEPAHPFAKPIYFEDFAGRILGPVIPEFLAKADDDFWIVTTWDCQTRWIRSDRLRSEQAFLTQAPVRIIEPG